MDDPESPVDNDLYRISAACRSIIIAIDRVTTTGEVRVQPEAVVTMRPSFRRKEGGHSPSYREQRFRVAAMVLEALARGEVPTAENLKTARTYFARIEEDCDSARFGP